MTSVRRSEGPSQGEPTGRGRAGRPRKYSPVGREGIGTSTVVQGKGELESATCHPGSALELRSEERRVAS